jgi:hypothetical protein
MNTSDDQEGKDDDLVTPLTDIEHIVGMMFVHDGDMIKYDDCKLYGFNKNNQAQYLYRKTNGRPGLFLASIIQSSDIRKMLVEDRDIFVRKKIQWFKHGKIVSKRIVMNTLNDNRKNEIHGIFEELKNRTEEISNKVIEILTSMPPEKILLTIMIEGKFIGEIPDYFELFGKGVLANKDDSKIRQHGELLHCSVCNKESLIHTFSETPSLKIIHTFFADKTHFLIRPMPPKAFQYVSFVMLM